MRSPHEDSTATERFDDDPIGPTPSVGYAGTEYVITAAEAAPTISQDVADERSFDDLGPTPFVTMRSRWNFVRIIFHQETGESWSKVHYE